jgi:peptide/nickel transport system substrate-binding protein
MGMPKVWPILLTGMIFLLGCRASERYPLEIAFRSSISNLDPIRENTVVSNSIYCNLYEPLVVRDLNLRIKPALAVEWSNPDDTTWLFKLRSNVRFHDGTPLRAQDVQFSLERARKDPTSHLVSSLAVLQRVDVINENTIRIETQKPYSILLSRLVDIWILPQNFFSKPRRSPEIPGTGPYRFAKWKQGQFVELSANPDYWGGKPPIERVRFIAIPDLTARLNFLKQNRAQIIPLLEPEALSDPVFQQPGKAQIHSTPGLTVLFLAMDVKREKTPHVNTGANPFRDYRVRKAIYHAVNIRKIVNDILRGNAMEATQLTAPKVFGHNASIRRLEYDPALSRKLLKQAGYPAGFAVRFDITNNRHRNDLEIGKSIADDLKEVGIQANVNAVGIEVLQQMRARGESSFQMMGWTLPSTDASGSLDYLVHSSNPNAGYGIQNVAGYSNPGVDLLIEESAGKIEPAGRAALLEKAMELCMNELPYIPLHVENSVLASRQEVNFEPRSDEYLYIKSMSWNKQRR